MFSTKSYDDTNEQDNYFTSLNLQLTGVITNDVDCPNGYNGFCIISLDVLQSNIQQYDPRNKKLRGYFCLIKGNKAQVYGQSMRECIKGDTLIIDTKFKKIIDKRLNVYFETRLSSDDRLYEYAEENHPF